MRYHLEFIPTGFPCVVRPCAKCGANRAFLPTNQFRINAQKKLLDVWLIHQCAECGHTWNMEVFSRVGPKQMARDIYDRLLENDERLIMELAFDMELHARMGCPLQMDTLRYELRGVRPVLPLDEPVELEITAQVSIGLRQSKVLREALGLSAARFEKMVAEGRISSLDGHNLMRSKLMRGLRVRLD